jgi:beta-galactosidase
MQGQAAVVRHRNAVTIGAWSAPLIREVLATLLTEAGIRVMDLPDGIRIARRGEAVTWMNYNQHPAPLPDGTIMPPVSFEVRVGG